MYTQRKKQAIPMYTNGKLRNGRLYVRTRLGNWIHLRLLLLDIE